MLPQEMSVSAVARTVHVNDKDVWRILKYYIDDSGKEGDLFHLDVFCIDEFHVKKHQV